MKRRSVALAVVAVLLVATAAHADNLDYDVVGGSAGQIDLPAADPFDVEVTLWAQRQGNHALESLSWEHATTCTEDVTVDYERFLGGESFEGEASLVTSAEYRAASGGGPGERMRSDEGSTPAYTVATITGTAPTDPGTCTVTLSAVDVEPSQSIAGGQRDVVVTLTFVGDDDPVDECEDREAPATTPTIDVTPSPDEDTGWFNLATGTPTFTLSPDTDVEYSTDDGETWTEYTTAVQVTTEGTTEVVARNILPAEGDCAALPGPASESVELKVDVTPPSVIPVDVIDTTWRNTPLSEDFSASDAGSGLADEDDAAFTLTVSEESTIEDGEVVPTVASRTVLDIAGNSTTRIVSAWIDTTPPTTTVTGIPIGLTVELGEDYPEYGCESTDALSGVADEATATLDESALNANGVGPVTVTCAGATDQAGNTADAASTSFRVVYPFDGFFRPIDMDAVNAVRAGQSVPTKFSLGGDYGLDVLAAGYPRAAIVSPLVCAYSEQIPTDLEGDFAESAGRSTLSYDEDADEYNYVWKTDRTLKSECVVLQVKLDDGSLHTARFSFK